MDRPCTNISRPTVQLSHCVSVWSSSKLFQFPRHLGCFFRWTTMCKITLHIGDTNSLNICGWKQQYHFFTLVGDVDCRPQNCHHPHHPIGCKILSVWVKCASKHTVFSRKFNLLSHFYIVGFFLGVKTANSHSHRPSLAKSPTIQSRLVQNKAF